MKLPKDIKAYVNKNIMKRLGKWLFFTLVTALLILLFNESFKEAEAGVRAFVYTTLLFIPFITMKIPQMALPVLYADFSTAQEGAPARNADIQLAFSKQIKKSPTLCRGFLLVKTCREVCFLIPLKEFFCYRHLQD